MPENQPRKLSITLRRSLIGCSGPQRLVVRSLGLRRIRHSVIRPDTPQVRGMISKIIHMLEVKEK